MSDATAIRVAMQLHQMPSDVRLFRERPLPQGIPLLLEVAAGNAEATSVAASLTGKSEPELRPAARFFVEQVLWHPLADSFRVLGATPETTTIELKRNMSLLMSWLHPDVGSDDERSVFAVRVASAWNDLKTPDRRMQYEASLNWQAEVQEKRRRRRAKREAMRREQQRLASRRGFWRRLLSSVFGTQHTR